MRLPTLFVSHGAPTLPLEPGPARERLIELGRTMPRPDAILVVSAHWLTRSPCVSAAPLPEIIHDFAGFPRQLYDIRYPAPGAPDLAARVADLGRTAGISIAVDGTRGLDHGAWVPLSLMYPGADIPVTQLSIQPHAGPRHHYELGRLLRPLARENVLILASGGFTHNLHVFGDYAYDAEPPGWVRAFRAWMIDRLQSRDLPSLLDYRAQAPHAVDNHPTDEHLLPLFVALGASEDAARTRHLDAGVTYGIIGMDSFVFAPPAGETGSAAPAQ